MQILMQKFEEEKRKLNELGHQSLEQGIPLSDNEAVQTQSRKLDEMVNRFYQEKNKQVETVSVYLNSCIGGDTVSFPAWFKQTMQGRIHEITAQIEYQSEPKDEYAFEEESKAFKALVESADITHMAEFEHWEDRLHIKQSVLYERLYLQGLKDGMQLANAFTASSVSSD